MFRLEFTKEAKENLEALKDNPALDKRYKSVLKALAFLSTNPKHSGLNSHKYNSKQGPNKEEIFEVYAENNTPGAYRIFWFYGPGKNVITILAITPHP